MAEFQSKLIAKQLIDEICTAGSTSLLFEITAVRCRVNKLFSKEPVTDDITRFVKDIAELHKGIPDAKVHILDMIYEDQKVSVLWSVEGTFLHEMCKYKPTGRKIKFHGFMLLKIIDNEINEIWISFDRLALTTQPDKLG